MQARTFLAIILLAILAFSWSAATANGSSINYAIHGEKVSVDLSLRFFQNATGMPNLSGTFTGSSAQDLTLALEESLKKRVGGVTVSSLSGELVSAGGWVNSTIRFELTGASTREGDFLIVNCSWMPFDVSRDLGFGNLSYNLIGATYIKPAFERYLDYDKRPLNETISGVTYLSGQSELTARLAVEKAAKAALLDFANLAWPIGSWKSTYNLTRDVTTWSYNPGPAVDLTMTVVPKEGPAFADRAFYNYNASLSVDGMAQAQGNVVRIDVYGGSKAFVMFAVIVLTFVVAVIASWNYRSRRKRMPKRR